MPRYSGRDQESNGGWHYDAAPTEAPHLCFPPEAYPTDGKGRRVGPGTRWRCHIISCGQVWMSYGVQVIGDWPQAITKNDVVLGPEFWRRDGNNPLLAPDSEEMIYDFRSVLDLILEELRSR